MKDITINLRISKQLLDSIDNDRGLIPRSAYIRDILEKKINLQPANEINERPQPKANDRAVNSTNAARAKAIVDKIYAGIESLNQEQKEIILSARYPKNEFRKAIGETVSKDSIAKYWGEIESNLNAG